MKGIRLFLAVVLIITLLPVRTLAASNSNIVPKIIYLDDGSYIAISLFISETRSNDKTASKVITFHNSLGSELWSATLHATFTFDGTEYWATASSISVNIQNSNWYEISKSASHSGCGATGNVTMGQKVLGVTVNKESATITLSCSPYGVIS